MIRDGRSIAALIRDILPPGLTRDGSFLALAAAIVLTAAACGGDDDGPTDLGGDGEPQVAVVEVTPGVDTLTALGATTQFTAAATDADGNAMSDVDIVWQSSRPGVASVDTTGVATAEASGEATITAIAQGVAGNAVLTVDQRTAEAAFIDQPSDATAGEALDPAVRVEIRDDAGNRVEDAEVAVTLSILDDPGGATLHGTRTVTTTAGVATFGGVWLDKAGAGYTLTADLDGTAADTSAAFDIAAAAAARVGFVQEPTPTEGAEPLAPVIVAVQDEFGNTVPDATDDVELALGPDAGAAVLGGESRVQAVDGLATFDSVTIDLPGSYTLEATAFPLRGARSAAFDVFLTFASVDAAGDLTCGRTEPGHAYCWGRSHFGGTTYFQTSTPIHNDGGKRYDEVRVSAGFGIGAIDESGSWEHFWDPRDPIQPEVASAPTPLSGATSDGSHHCAISDGGDAYCFGFNVSGQLGNGDTANIVVSAVAAEVGGSLAFARLDAGGLHTCGVTTSGDAYCWGSSEWGQVGAAGGAAEPDCFGPPCSLTPIAVGGGLTFESVTAGGRHSCGVTTAGEAYCWGHNADGQLGNPVADSSSVPVPVDDPAGGAVTWDRLSAGIMHTCGITTSGEAYCWGSNVSGRLGIGGSGGTEAVPQPVSGGHTFAEIDAGGLYTCAVTPDGDAYCWGQNDFGRLGDGTNTLRTEPTLVVQ